MVNENRERLITKDYILIMLACMGFMIGGIVFGYVADRYGYPVLYWAGAGLSLIALMLYIKAVAEKKIRKAQTLEA